MKDGDRVLIYHSQGESARLDSSTARQAIVGLAEIVGNGKSDPREPRSWLQTFKFIKKFKEPYVTLQEVKQSGKFNDFRLVRQSRLSTMDVPENFIDWLSKKGVL